MQPLQPFLPLRIPDGAHQVHVSMSPSYAEGGTGSAEGQGLGLPLRCGLVFAGMYRLPKSFLLRRGSIEEYVGACEDQLVQVSC